MRHSTVFITLLASVLILQDNCKGNRHGGAMQWPSSSPPPTWWHKNSEHPGPDVSEPDWKPEGEGDYDLVVTRGGHGQDSGIYLTTDDFDLANVGYHRCIEHIHKEPPNRVHYYPNKTPILNFTGADSSRCIELYDIPGCKGMSFQFLNVTKKTLLLNKFGEPGEGKERLLNFNLVPNSFQKCVPIEQCPSKELETWKINTCNSEFQIKIDSSYPSKATDVSDSCIEIKKPESVPRSPRTKQFDVSISIIKNLREEVCLELYTERDCRGEIVRVLLPPPIPPADPNFIPSPVLIWEYFSNSSGTPFIDTDVNSVRKCAPCLNSPQIKFPNDAESTSSLVSTATGLPSPEKPENETHECDFSGCNRVTDFLSIEDLSERVKQVIESGSQCYFFFKEPQCFTPPVIQDKELNLTILEQVISKFPQFDKWSVSDCDSHGEILEVCLVPSKPSMVLHDIFKLENWKNFIEPPSEKKGPSTVIGDNIVIAVAGLFSLIMLVIVVIMAIMLCRKRRRIRMMRERRQVPKQSNASTTNTPQTQRHMTIHQIDSIHENDYVNDVTGLHALIKCFAKDKYELSRESINIGNIRDSSASIIGVGEFSIAFRGRLEPSGRAITVKTMKSGQATTRSMKGALKECQVFMMVGKHARIVEFVGVCTEGVKNGELFVVMEFCEVGALRGFLAQQKNNFVNLVEEEETIPKNENVANEALHPLQKGPPLRFNTFQLFKWCWEVADALEFLAEKKIVHVSLSARNVLLDSNYSSKICDFHLAKIPGENSATGYNRRTATNKLHERHIPWRWFAVESLLDDIFTTQSDVWTFGVFMWEVFTLGSTPFPEYHHGPEFTLCLKHGYRLLKPNFTTIECYELMLMCWYDAPEKRPTFTKIKSRLEEMMMQKVYLVD